MIRIMFVTTTIRTCDNGDPNVLVDSAGSGNKDMGDDKGNYSLTSHPLAAIIFL